jgi:hypothetical protein
MRDIHFPMKRTILALLATALLLPTLHAEEDKDSNENRSSNLTPTAPRPVNMANPNKPTWQAEPHGK